MSVWEIFIGYLVIVAAVFVAVGAWHAIHGRKGRHR